MWKYKLELRLSVLFTSPPSSELTSIFNDTLNVNGVISAIFVALFDDFLSGEKRTAARHIHL